MKYEVRSVLPLPLNGCENQQVITEDQRNLKARHKSKYQRCAVITFDGQFASIKKSLLTVTIDYINTYTEAVCDRQIKSLQSTDHKIP